MNSSTKFVPSATLVAVFGYLTWSNIESAPQGINGPVARRRSVGVAVASPAVARNRARSVRQFGSICDERDEEGSAQTRQRSSHGRWRRRGSTKPGQKPEDAQTAESASAAKAAEAKKADGENNGRGKEGLPKCAPPPRQTVNKCWPNSCSAARW